MLKLVEIIFFEEEREKFNIQHENKIIMKKSEIINVLKRLGLSEYEAKAYFALLRLGSAKATTISLKSDVPQSKVYSTLQNLMNKQLVEMLDGRPKEYRAVSPEFALKSLIREKEMEIKQLAEEISIISKLLKKETEEVVSGIWTIKGKKWKKFFNRVAEMIDRSEKYVYAVTKNYSFTSRLGEAVKLAVRRGVKIKVIGLEAPNEKNYFKIKWYVRCGIKLKYFPTTTHPRIVVVDGKEVLLRLDYDPSKKEGFAFSSLWSNDKSFAKVFDSYLKNLWKNSKPIIFSKDIPSLS